MYNPGYAPTPITTKHTELTQQALHILEYLAAEYAKGAPTMTDVGTPPGLVGVLTQYTTYAAYKQQPSFSLLSVLGYVAGIVGSRYYVGDNGLNIFALLLGSTGRGKSVAGKTKRLLNKSLKLSLRASTSGGIVAQSVNAFVSNSAGYTGSTAALEMIEGMKQSNSLLCHVREGFGFLSSALEDKHGMMDITLDMFTESGPDATITAKKLAKDDPLTFINSAVSLLLELQPEAFTPLLNTSLVTRGLIPRMLITPPPANVIPYTGPEPELDKTATAQLEELIDYCLIAGKEIPTSERAEVRYSEGAAHYRAAHAHFCDQKAGEPTTDVIAAQFLSRTAEKTERVAGIIAVGVNHLNPIIDEPIYDCARRITWMCDMSIFMQANEGLVGEGLAVQIATVVAEVQKVAKMKPAQVIEAGLIQTKNPILRDMQAKLPAISKSKLKDRLSKKAVFCKINGKNNPNTYRDIDNAIEAALDGKIMKVPDAELPAFGYKITAVLLMPATID